ncbi:hypothetical protein A2U01_0077458, partial [Trifolium medium]|nr:hypothetical protein [Trifolium medium]
LLSLARRADVSGATRRSCCERRFSFGRWRGAPLGLARRAGLWSKGRFCFWCLRDAQLGPARRVELPCLVLFASGVGAARAGSLRGAQVC